MTENSGAPRVSIILINWNGLEMTAHALQSLRHEIKGVSWEAIVIDNGSTRDDSVKELPARFPWVRFILSPENEGFGKACNRGTQIARGDYLLFLNNDTLQVEDSITKATEYMDAHHEVGALGIRHLDSQRNHEVQPSSFPFPNPITDALGCIGLTSLAPAVPEFSSDEESDVDWVCGSFLMVRRRCWDQVGSFDERFFVYDEDVDWCHRAWKHGWKVRFWPGTRMVHYGAASAPALRDKTFMHFRSRMIYHWKNHSKILAGVFYASMCLRLGVCAAIQMMKFAARRATSEETLDRFERLVSFLTLRSARRGVKPG